MYTVLLIDDDKKLAKLNTDVLKWHTYDVMTAYSLEEAEERLGEKLPDLILLETEISGGGGIEYCRRLKSRYSVPVILLSTEGKGILEGLKAGADEYIVKPYDIGQLMAKVEINIQKYKRNDQGGC